MMTKAEGNKYLAQLITLAKAYVESDLTWIQIQAIAEQMLQGKTFNDVVTQLNLNQQISPDLPVMMTIIDKQSILDTAADIVT